MEHAWHRLIIIMFGGGGGFAGIECVDSVLIMHVRSCIIVDTIYRGRTSTFILLDSGTSKDKSLLVCQHLYCPAKDKNNSI